MNAAHDGLLRQLDLNLLAVFEMVYAEQNLTRAGRRLFVSQSAVSHALARLREQLGDALFVRRGAGVVPTLAAERLAPAVHAAFSILRRSLETREFEAQRDLGRVVLALHDGIEPTLLPAFAQRLSRASPDVELESVRLDRRRFERDLGSGRIDFAIDVARATGGELRHVPLVEDEFCIVSRRRRRLDKSAYLAAQHVTVSSRRSGLSLEDLLLSQLGYERKLALRCQRYETACRLVAQSDLLLTAPAMQARAIAKRLGLVALKLPFTLPPFTLRLYWHRQVEEDPRSRFLRGELLASAAAAER